MPASASIRHTGAMSSNHLTTSARYLAAYDAQLRTDAEAASASRADRLGPLWLLTFGVGHGFITYQDLGDADSGTLRRLVADASTYYRDYPEIHQVEWKTRGHDYAPGLHESLLENGFVAGEPESIMIGHAQSLAVEVTVPAGVTIRRVTAEPDVRAMTAMQAVVFGESDSYDRAAEMLRRIATDDGMELWVAEAGGEIVAAGRLDPVADSDFAGIWGGATLAPWRGRGIYRALTSARARSARAKGKTLIHSDSTSYSRPILERSGFIAVSTTTPYEWKR